MVEPLLKNWCIESGQVVWSLATAIKLKLQSNQENCEHQKYIWNVECYCVARKKANQAWDNWTTSKNVD